MSRRDDPHSIENQLRRILEELRAAEVERARKLAEASRLADELLEMAVRVLDAEAEGGDELARHLEGRELEERRRAERENERAPAHAQEERYLVRLLELTAEMEPLQAAVDRGEELAPESADRLRVLVAAMKDLLTEADQLWRDRNRP